MDVVDAADDGDGGGGGGDDDDEDGIEERLSVTLTSSLLRRLITDGIFLDVSWHSLD